MTASQAAENSPGNHEKQAHTPPGDGSADCEIGEWRVEPGLLRITRDGDSIKLEPKVMAVLVYLAQRPGQVVSRETLEEAVWAGTIVSYDALTGAIQKLRKAFNDDPRRPQFIETLSKRGYRLVATVSSLPQPGEDSPVAQPGTSRFRLPGFRDMALLLIILVGVTLTLLFILPSTDERSGTTVAPVPSIAVLPFDNLNNNPDQAYFSDGITDDLITGLAKHGELLVISRDSSFLYKDRQVDTRQVADKLGVRYILTGSVRRDNQQIRINAQLVDARNNSLLWAEHYDGLLRDIFSLQDSITHDIITALAIRLAANTAPPMPIEADSEARAYDNFLMGRQNFYLFASQDDNNKARAFFKTAIEYNPNLAQAYAMLAWTHVYDVMNSWSDNRDRSLLRAIELSDQALSLRQDLPVAYFVRGLAHRERGEYIPGLVDAEQAITYDPNYAHAHMLLATLLYYAGRPDDGLQRIRQAMLINPHHPYNYTFHLGQAYYILGRYDDAVSAFEEGIASNPASERTHIWLAAAYAKAGNTEDAEWEMEQVRMLNPELSLDLIEQQFPFKDKGDLEHFMDGLKTAGF